MQRIVDVLVIFRYNSVSSSDLKLKRPTGSRNWNIVRWYISIIIQNIKLRRCYQENRRGSVQS